MKQPDEAIRYQEQAIELAQDPDMKAELQNQLKPIGKKCPRHNTAAAEGGNVKLGANTVLFAGHDVRTALGTHQMGGIQRRGAFGHQGDVRASLPRQREQQAGDIRALSADLDLPITAMEEAALDEARL